VHPGHARLVGSPEKTGTVKDAYQETGEGVAYIRRTGNTHSHYLLPFYFYYSRSGGDLLSGKYVPGNACLRRCIYTGERFGPIETTGAAVALTGAFIISYSGETSWQKFFIPGTGVVLINSIFATIASLVVKVHVRKISAELLNLNRSVWLLIFSFIMFFIYRQSFIIPVSALQNIVIGALLGPFIAILALYYSFHYFEASRSSVVQSLKGIFVLIGAWLFFGTFPLPHQLVGGLITIAGVLVMSVARAGFFRNARVES
jgi:drug/metabolite transporter (DMT)-like permease